jgi:predicted Fe-Mo cluster-binding NifX family protein
MLLATNKEVKMIICIAAQRGQVCPHFGHCPEFALYEVEEGETRQMKLVPNPGHSPGTLPPLLREWGVTHVISGGMGPRAVSLFQSMGIDVVTGAQGRLDETARSFVAGELESQDNICDHPEDHSCGHGGDPCQH